MTKTQTLSSSRAGLSSPVVTDAGTGKTQIISNVGVVTASPTTSTSRFIIHPFV